MKTLVALFAVCFLSASAASATTYYVRTDGLDAHAGTSNTAGGAWLTITKGCTTAAAGDTVRVQAGTYVETASGCVSGTSGNTVTLIADGVVTTCGMSFTSKSYIRVIRFTMNPAASTCGGNPHPILALNGTNTGLEFWNDDVTNTSAVSGNGMGTSTGTRCNACIVIGGSVSNIGNQAAGDSIAFALVGDDNFVGYMTIGPNICYVGMSPGGLRGRYVNNNFSGMCDAPTHVDFFYTNINSLFDATSGFSQSLIESSFGVGNNTNDQNKWAHQQNQNANDWLDDVYRLNVATQVGSSVYSTYSSSPGANLRLRWYNNTWAIDQAANTSPDCGTGAAQVGGFTVTNYFYNELYDHCWKPGLLTNVDVFMEGQTQVGTFTFVKDYNLAWTPSGSAAFTGSWTGQTHKQTNANPQFTNAAGNDFTLQSSSLAKGNGGPLTTATSCSGTTLNVATNTGGFFIGDNSANLVQYGGALGPGDVITVVSTPYHVASVSGDAITVTGAIACANGDAVYFGSSSTIDIGAYPYKATGYTLSATSQANGGTETITPNDPSLVRFVVCYNDNVPYTVVNSSPYTCAVPAGAFSARVYPRYASQTQYADAGIAGLGSITLRALKKKVRKD